MSLFFEGSEKKIEIIFKPSAPNLRSLGKAFWDDVVWASGAKILSQVSNEHMDAYLLSESSLFVYDQYLVMITCGRTRLIQAVKKILSVIKPQHIEAFFYERKNEVFPQYQPTDFFEDLRKLNKWFKGQAMRFGQEDEHHLFLFSTDKSYTPAKDDHTMEILMHGVLPQRIEMFQKENVPMARQAKQLAQVQALVKGQIDDHIFDPCGYSLNAIDGPYYYTIHVTPEKIGNYTSFETDACSPEEQFALANKVVDFFQPVSFDLVLFNKEVVSEMAFEKYVLKNRYQQNLNAGYTTQYYTYYKPQEEPQGAFVLQEMDL
ncbi:adenosylmethionine decarboxylase [bacterium]|nr:adenosylmethionine decarboxylase [bacterium]